MRSPHRRPILAAAAATALPTSTACTDNPVAPASASLHAASSPSFSRSASGPYTFTRFDVEIAGTTYPTIPSGINASGVVVGYYWLGTGCPSNPTTCVMNGFILKDGVLTTPVIYHNAAGTKDRKSTRLNSSH